MLHDMLGMKIIGEGLFYLSYYFKIQEEYLLFITILISIYLSSKSIYFHTLSSTIHFKWMIIYLWISFLSQQYLCILLAIFLTIVIPFSFEVRFYPPSHFLILLAFFYEEAQLMKVYEDFLDIHYSILVKLISMETFIINCLFS